MAAIMSFVHGNLAMATFGLAAIPLIIHLLNRRRYRDEPWAAMQFILAAYQRTRRRLRVEQIILWAVRTLVMALVGLAIARPYLRPQSALLSVGERRIDRVFVLDDSFSMQAQQPDGQTAFDVAKDTIARLIEQSGGSGGFAIVTASRPVRAWMDQPIRDRMSVRQSLDAARVTWGTTDLAGAMALADQVLSRGDAAAEGREIYVLSDFSRHTIGAFSELDEDRVQLDGRSPHASRVVLVDTGGDERANRALSALSVVGQPASLNGMTTVRAAVSNFTAAEMRNVEVVVRDGRRDVGRNRIEQIAAGEIGTVDMEVPLEAGRVHVLEASLPSGERDSLVEDDQRLAIVSVPAHWRVLAVEGAVSPTRSESPLFYYKLALSPAVPEATERSPFVVNSVRPEELNRVVLNDHDVVVLGDVSGLTPLDGDRLRQFVSTGGGLVVFCGESFDAGAAEALGELSPARILEVRQADSNSPPPMMTLADPQHVILSDFVGQKRNILGKAHVTAWRRLDAAQPGRTFETIIATNNGEPILVAARHGHGRVVTWLTSADMSWTNLPAKPDYLPLMTSVTCFAAGDGNVGRNVSVGQVLSGPVGTRGARSVEVKSPGGRGDAAELTLDGPSIAWRFARTQRPGVYEVTGSGEDGPYGVNIDAQESDLRSADQERMARAFGSRAVFVARPEVEKFAQVGDVRELGWLLALLLLVAATGESLLGRMFGGAR